MSLLPVAELVPSVAYAECADVLRVEVAYGRTERSDTEQEDQGERDGSLKWIDG